MAVSILSALSYLSKRRHRTLIRSDNVDLQARAFKCITRYFILFPSDALSAFRDAFDRRKEISDVVTFSWKRSGVEYTIKWLCYYKMVSRC